MVQIGVDREGFRPSYRPVKPAPGMDPALKRLGLILAALGGMAALAIGAGSLLGARHHGIPVIEAEAGPVRVKPENAGGMQVTGADFAMGPGTTQTLAPSAEQPQINALRAQLKAMKKDLARQAAETAQATKIAEAARAKIVAAPPLQRASATMSFTEPEAPPPARPAPPVSGTSVQLAAFTDAAAAQTGWALLLKKAPELLGGRAPDITKTQFAGRTMWRLRTGGFDSVTQAAAFCAKMRDHGADCSIAAF
jgi:hypothetical protein